MTIMRIFLAIIITFLNQVAEKSERPEYIFKSMSSALKHWLKAKKKKLQVQYDILDKFVKALIRVETTRQKAELKYCPFNCS